MASEIDLRKLEKEVVDAVAADQLYWQQNDAKFRAVHQKVATYEEFRDIVQAAHLKPLEKKDKMPIDFKQPWNVAVNDSKSGAQSQPPQLGVQKTLPNSSLEFAREWKRLGKNNADRYKFLLSIDAQHLSKIFRVEISYGLLGEIISTLHEGYTDSSETIAILEVLNSLSSANRFSLSLQFLSAQETKLCCDLFGKLVSADLSDKQELLVDLKQKFNLK